MAKLAGGIFSRPSGKTAEIVFGAARTRTGKVVTARQFVSPSNPNTTDQQTQRNIFRESLAIVRSIGPSMYQSYFNRAVSQLPGFQSLMSIYMNNMDSNLDLSVPADTNLGTLHYPSTFSLSAGTNSGEVDLTFSSESGSNGTEYDQLRIIAIQQSGTNRTPIPALSIPTGFERGDGGDTVSGLVPNTAYIFAIFMVGVGSADGLLSVAHWYEATSKA